MVNALAFNAISNMQKSWEIARNQCECIENVGPAILRILLERSGRWRKPFGFQKGVNFSHPLLQQALLIHGAFITQLLDDMMSFTGPDEDTFHLFLSDMAKEHRARGFPLKHYEELGTAVRIYLKRVIKDDYTQRMDDAWESFFAFISEELKNVANQQRAQRRLLEIQNAPTSPTSHAIPTCIQ